MVFGCADRVEFIFVLNPAPHTSKHAYRHISTLLLPAHHENRVKREFGSGTLGHFSPLYLDTKVNWEYFFVIIISGFQKSCLDFQEIGGNFLLVGEKNPPNLKILSEKAIGPFFPP